MEDSKIRKRLIIGALAAGLISASAISALLFRSGSAHVPQTRSSGEALVGGPFTLTNHLGETVTDETYSDKYKLFYFGFTYCPDVCPLSLQIMAVALEELGPLNTQIHPLFVTVDPERDTPESLAAYVAQFHPNLIGLTGTVDQIKAVTSAYRVYARKTQDPASAGEYTMDHSSIFYLMAPDGSYVSHFTHVTDPEAMAREITQVLKK